MPRALLVAVPVALAAVTAFHPTGHREHVFAVLAPLSGRWLTVHYLQLVLLPLAGLVLAALLGAERSGMARLARIAIYLFVVYYSVFDGIAGLAVGTLIRRGATMPPAESAVIADAAQALFRDPWIGGLGALGGAASLAWLTACLAMAVIARRRGASWVVAGALAVSGALLAVTHAPPLGPPAFIALAVAAVFWPRPLAANREGAG